jgi:hypothetical protein
VVPAAVQRPFELPPAVIGLQRPLACPVSVIEQDWQRPVQAFSQQMFPTQAPLVHWLFPEQVDPFVILAAQVLPEVQ